MKNIDPDTINKLMFVEVLNRAREAVGGNVKLAARLGVSNRTIEGWLKGHMPTYSDMQRNYFALSALFLPDEFRISPEFRESLKNPSTAVKKWDPELQAATLGPQKKRRVR